MFRLWAKEFKDNRMIRDTTIEDSSEDTRTHKVFRALGKCAMSLIWESRSGLRAQSLILNGLRRHGFIRTVSWRSLSLIIWKSM